MGQLLYCPAQDDLICEHATSCDLDRLHEQSLRLRKQSDLIRRQSDDLRRESVRQRRLQALPDNCPLISVASGRRADLSDLDGLARA